MRSTRRTLVISGVLLLVSGCTSSDPEEEGEEDVDNGVVIEEAGLEGGQAKEELVTVQEGQTITATVDGLEEGDEVLFTVGDGTGFVHREHIYDGTDEYTVESTGDHSVRVHPQRYEYPMDAEVTVDVQVEITEP